MSAPGVPGISRRPGMALATRHGADQVRPCRRSASDQAGRRRAGDRSCTRAGAAVRAAGDQEQDHGVGAGVPVIGPAPGHAVRAAGDQDHGVGVGASRAGRIEAARHGAGEQARRWPGSAGLAIDPAPRQTASILSQLQEAPRLCRGDSSSLTFSGVFTIQLQTFVQPQAVSFWASDFGLR